MKRLSVAVAAVCALVAAGRVHAAAENWFEIKSQHFTVRANANDGNTRTLVWQLEQIRSAVKTMWPWAKVDLGKPLLVLAVKNESTMKALVPWYWEQRDGIRPGSVWVSGPDQYYIAIRTDMRVRDDVLVNPHVSTYFSYVNLILSSSFERELPLWYSRGLAGVISNTLVRDDHLLLGATIPWHLERLRERRLPLRQMLSVTRDSPDVKLDDRVRYFDAQAWVFVHYLMFGDGGTHGPKLNAFVQLLDAGKPADAAFAEALGNVDDYDRALANYVNRNVFGAAKVRVDADVKREKFAARPLPEAESAGGRASFLVAMGRPAEATAVIAEAKKADPKSPHVRAAEALLLDREGKDDEAKVAYREAAEAGSTNPYVYYRSAVLEFPRPDEQALQVMEKNLARAVELNPSFAAAHATLAEVRAMLKHSQATIVPHMRKAVALEPADPWHRLAAARTLWRLGAPVEARQAAETALRLADSDAARQEAERLLKAIK